ncbi:hypothetical protein IQ07DRAFT_603794 [Pyrenochaeta sp. DS3sAY3a]|nr:hypothetical protein IQ07DRAFT_603794 [Pyrenochaeta sp. DS3sAY3a]
MALRGPGECYALIAAISVVDQIQATLPGSWINCGGGGLGWSQMGEKRVMVKRVKEEIETRDGLKERHRLLARRQAKHGELQAASVFARAAVGSLLMSLVGCCPYIYHGKLPMSFMGRCTYAVGGYGIGHGVTSVAVGEAKKCEHSVSGIRTLAISGVVKEFLQVHASTPIHTVAERPLDSHLFNNARGVKGPGSPTDVQQEQSLARREEALVQSYVPSSLPTTTKLLVTMFKLPTTTSYLLTVLIL